MRHNSDPRHLDLRTCPALEAMAFERTLALSLRHVIEELFCINAGNLVAYINTDKTENIEDLVASSAERSLRPGVLHYGGHAFTQFDWGCPPTVTVDLEFHHNGLSAYFQLVFEATTVGVSIGSITFPEALRDHAEYLARLESTLADARRLDS